MKEFLIVVLFLLASPVITALELSIICTVLELFSGDEDVQS